MKPFPSARQASQDHPRLYRENRYVYPVFSRRSKGISLGVNLNLDKACNFDCPYCQVDRTVPGPRQEIDVAVIIQELTGMLSHFDEDGTCTLDLFRHLSPEDKKLRDVALSGDGEPTMVPEFETVCEALYRLQSQSKLPFQLTLITNATLLHKTQVRRGIEWLLKKRGAVWAKLDAGTEEWYRKVNLSRIPFESLLKNMEAVGTAFPLTLQTLFHKIHGQGPDEKEIKAYIQRVKSLQKAGVAIPEIQLHTLARKPAADFCDPLSPEELRAIGDEIHQQTGIPVSATA